MDNGKLSLFDFSLDDLTQDTAVRPINTAIANNLFGINHRQTPSAVPLNRDQYGFAFFTRPQLNLQSENIRGIRHFFPLLQTRDNTYQSAIRNLLDPRIGRGWAGHDAYDSVFVDWNQAFIPMLTNNIVSMSGWHDMVLPTFNAKEGAYKEGFSMPDGIVVDYTTYDLTCSFRNTIGDPITALFFYWIIYMAGVFEGVLMPYPDFLLQNEMDYNTRIWRLVLDKTKTRVQRIACTGAAFPTTVPLGGLFNFNLDKPYNDVNAEISVQFRCMGACYNDDILVHEFNHTVGIFNESLRNVKWTKKTNAQGQFIRNVVNSEDMVMIDYSVLQLFNSRGYPYIDPETYDLQWYIQRDLYEAKLAKQAEYYNAVLDGLSINEIPSASNAAQTINI